MALSFTKTALAIGLSTLMLTLVSCSAPEPQPTQTPTPAPSTLAPVAPSGDGILRISTLFAVQGESSPAQIAETAGVELAVREINEAGGVAGQPVEVFHRNLSDRTTDAAASAVADLSELGADVVISLASDALAEAQSEQQATGGAGTAAVIAFPVAGADGAPLDGREVDDAFIARLKSSDPAVTEPAFGLEAYQAAMVAALAATIMGDDGSTSITRGLTLLTGEGVPCSSFGECVDVLKTEPAITFVRGDAPIEFSAANDPETGYTELSE